MDKLILALPKFNEVIAPCFEVTSTFVFITIENGQKTAVTIEHCEDCEGIGRVRFIQSRDADVLICNGIKSFYKDMLISSGVKVISGIGLNIEQAIAEFLAGILDYNASASNFINVAEQMPLTDLICWTKDLFKTHGYDVHKGENRAPFPIDLVAEMKCPVCLRPIRIAICCGAHSYRPDQELLEFRRASANDYHAQVYIHPSSPELKRRCDEFGIELLDPLEDLREQKSRHKRKIPILTGAVLGHEKI